MKLLHYNIAHGRGNDTSPDVIGTGVLGLALGSLVKNMKTRIRGKDALLSRLDGICEFIERQNVDVVCLNEADFSCDWSYHIDMPAYLSERLGLQHVAKGTKSDVQFMGFRACHGVAILSRHPLYAAYRHFAVDDSPRKAFGGLGYLNAIVHAPAPFRLVCTHLNPGEEGKYQSAQIREQAIRPSRLPVILAGDLNASLDAPLLQELLTGGRLRAPGALLKEHAQERYATFTSKKQGPRTIDHILVDESLEIVSYDVPNLSYSDHRPVLVEVRERPCLASPEPAL